MADNVVFEDFTVQVENALDDGINAVLEECAGEIESQAKQNTPVGKINGSRTKNSWQHHVDDSTHTAYIGNDKETAIWIEFGTGEHALEGKGRKGGWWIPVGAGGISQHVVDAYGFKTITTKDGKTFAFTKGMKPKRPLFNAYNTLKNAVIKRIQGYLRGLGS